MKSSLNTDEGNFSLFSKIKFSQIKFRLLLGIACFFILSAWKCGKEEEQEKPEELIAGTYKGGAIVAKGNFSKALSVTINSEGNPVKGSFSFGAGSDLESGVLSGSALGLIYNLKLTASPSGAVYTISCTWGDKRLTGTMKGSPNGVATEYTIDLIKQ